MATGDDAEVLPQSTSKQAQAFPDGKTDAFVKASSADVSFCITKYRDHFIPVLMPVKLRVEMEQPSVETEHSGQAPFRATRRAASLVKCLILSISSCRCGAHVT